MGNSESSRSNSSVPTLGREKRRKRLEEKRRKRLERKIRKNYYYIEDFLKDTATDNAIRVNVVGNFAQGKTSLNPLVERYNECVQSTNGVDINHCKYSDWFEETSNLEMTKDCQFDDEQLSRISTAIGKEWERLGTELGLHNVQLEHIEMDNRTTLKRIYKMLKLWVAEKEENATVNALIQAMKSAKTVTIYWDEVRNIVEEIASKR